MTLFVIVNRGTSWISRFWALGVLDERVNERSGWMGEGQTATDVLLPNMGQVRVKQLITLIHISDNPAKVKRSV